MSARLPSSPRPLKLRLLLFLYSTANIAGCALALLGPALLFAGVIGPGWGFITAGLYGAGWAVGWAARSASGAGGDGGDDDADVVRFLYEF